MAVGCSNSDSPVAIYRLNEAAAATNALDSGGSALDLTQTGTPAAVCGWIDGARRCGTGAWFERLDAALVFAPASLTVQVALRVRVIPASELAIIHDGDGILAGGGNYGWAITLTTAGLIQLVLRGNLSTVNTTTRITLVSSVQVDRKIHLAFTSTGGQDASSAGGTVAAYVDGAVVYGPTTGIARGRTSSTTKFMVGRWDGGTSVDADIEDVGVYSSARSATLIRIDALNSLGRGMSATSVSGTLSTALTALGHQSTYTEHRISTYASPRAFAPVSLHDVSNGKAAPADAIGQVIAGAAHLRGRHPKIILSKPYLPASTGVAGPLVIGYAKWTTSPTAAYAIVRAWCETSTTSSSVLEPRMYFNGDTATAVKWLTRHTTVTTPGYLEGRVALTPGTVTPLTVTIVDNLRVTALHIQEEPREDLDGSALYISPDACTRGKPATNDNIGGIYRWLADLYQEQRPPYLSWSLTETAAGLAHTVASYVNVLDGTTQSAWTTDGNPRGWTTYPFRRGYSSSGIAYATARCHFASAVAADTTVRFASASNVVDVAVGAGQSGWFDGASSLQLRSAMEEEPVQIMITTGGGLSTLTGLYLLPTT